MQLKWLDKKLCPPVNHLVLRGDLVAMLRDPHALHSLDALAAVCEFVPVSAAAAPSATVAIERSECCGKVLIGTETIDAHMKSRSHKARNKKKRAAALG